MNGTVGKRPRLLNSTSHLTLGFSLQKFDLGQPGVASLLGRRREMSRELGAPRIFWN